MIANLGEQGQPGPSTKRLKSDNTPFRSIHLNEKKRNGSSKYSLSKRINVIRKQNFDIYQS